MSIPLSADLIGMVAAAFLTLCVFSYLLGDNFLYRLAAAILVGGGAAFVFAVMVCNVLMPRVFIPLLSDREVDRIGWSFAMAGALLGALLIFKWFPRWAWVGNFPIAYVLGVGAGVAVGGAALGTLFAQSQAAALSQGSQIPVLDPLIMLVVTLTVFISFTFVVGGQRGLSGTYTRLVKTVSTFGRACLAVAFGVIFASAYIASVSVLISRVQFIVKVIKQFVILP